MSTIQELLHYTSRTDFSKAQGKTYLPTQLGNHVYFIDEDHTDIDSLDIILVGCGEFRGQSPTMEYSNGPDLIREEFYKLHYWHAGVKIGDIGNILQGVSLGDTRAALKTVLHELQLHGKKVLVLGGSHDLTLQQYNVFREQDEIIDFTVIDMLADLDDTSGNRYDNHLMEALTSSPNFVRHFNLLGFQSYFVNPNLIETFDRLHFDCIRVGKAREDIEQLEPVLRSSHIASIDINAIRYSDAPANKLGSPNGFYGDEMCKLTRFAGMSTSLCSMGIYGYIPQNDTELITAKLLAQMVWYFVDGVNVLKNESPLEDLDQFMEYQITFTDNNALFMKSKKTNRWWMKLPNDSFIPCSHKDYITACNNEIPERWMREVERLV
jgi:arginase family enzyme